MQGFRFSINYPAPSLNAIFDAVPVISYRVDPNDWNPAETVLVDQFVNGRQEHFGRNR